MDFTQTVDRDRIAKALQAIDDDRLRSGPIVGGKLKKGAGPKDVTSPADRSRVVGEVSEATQADVDEAMKLAQSAQIKWDDMGGPARAKVLRAMGDALKAKPAEQTPLIAAEAVRVFHAAGLDPNLLALLPGRGETVGAMLTAHPEIDGVAFTGGTDTAWRINRTLADRQGPIIPLIAETGGLNGMFVDTSAVREQVIDDVILSAFGSAGQRCSALRVLYVPKDSAEGLIEGLSGAMDALVLGAPADASTDVGPVSDEEARNVLQDHLGRLEKDAKVRKRLDPGAAGEKGVCFGPVMAEIPSPDFLEREVFGPVLHVYRYDPAKLPEVAKKLAARGYGLTLGVHSRIAAFAEEVTRLVPAGNVYVNRSIIGAVVGVQPIAGEGLRGAGPKAGGPHALIRYAVERAVSINIAAQGGDPALLNL